MSIGEIIGASVAAALTFTIFSFLYKDNWLFKLGEHIFLGFAVGYGWCIYYWNEIYPKALQPLFYPNAQAPFSPLTIIPVLLGLFIILRIVPRLSWLSRISFALYVGGFAGLAVPNVISGTFLPQLTATIAPLTGSWWMILLATLLVVAMFAMLAYSSDHGRWYHWLVCLALAVALFAAIGFRKVDIGAVNQLVLLVGVFCTVVFFFFSLEHRGTVGRISRIGVLVVMVAFGASFGYTVMARVSLLIGRFQFLIHDWIQHTLLGQ